MSSYKKLTCNYGDFEAGVYQRLQIGETVSHVGIFYQAFLPVAPLPFSLVQISPHSPWVLGLGQINTCRKAPFQVIFLADDILHYFFKSYLSTGNYFTWPVATIILARCLNCQSLIYPCRYLDCRIQFVKAGNNGKKVEEIIKVYWPTSSIFKDLPNITKNRRWLQYRPSLYFPY